MAAILESAGWRRDLLQRDMFYETWWHLFSVPLFLLYLEEVARIKEVVCPR